METVIIRVPSVVENNFQIRVQFLKMTSFYDNEMGYSARMAELAIIFNAI